MMSDSADEDVAVVPMGGAAPEGAETAMPGTPDRASGDATSSEIIAAAASPPTDDEAAEGGGMGMAELPIDPPPPVPRASDNDRWDGVAVEGSAGGGGGGGGESAYARVSGSPRRSDSGRLSCGSSSESPSISSRLKDFAALGLIDPMPSPQEGEAASAADPADGPAEGDGSGEVNGEVNGEVGGAIESAYARVEVTDPQQDGEGRSRYTSYRLIVTPSVLDTKPTEVNRRFSDFQWLYRRFLKEKPGAIVPMMPHKQALTQEARFSEEVISFRRKSCEIWLGRIIKHPELHRSPSLSAFLKADAEMFKTAKKSDDIDMTDHGDEQVEDPQSKLEWGGTSKTGSKKRFPRIQAMAHKVKVAMRSQHDLERSDDEPAFEEINDYVNELHVQITWLSKHGTTLIKTYKEQHNAFEAVGTKFSAIGAIAFPNTHSSNSARLSALFNKVGDGVSAIGFNELGRHDELEERFEQPLQDLVRDVSSLMVALQQRRAEQVKYTDRVNKVESRSHVLMKVRDNPVDIPSMQEMRTKDAEESLAEAQREAEVKLEIFNATSARLLREVERFRVDFRDSVRALVREWANVQGEYNVKANEGWGVILPFLDSPDIVTDTAGGGYSLSGQNGPQLDSV